MPQSNTNDSNSNERETKEAVHPKRSPWLSLEQLQTLSDKTNVPLQTIRDWHVDVTTFACPEYTNTNNANRECCPVELQPMWFRIRQSSPPEVYSTALHLEANHENQDARNTKAQNIRDAEQISSTTLRWCQDFVASLDLCPWAKLSLASHETAIRIKVMRQEEGLDEMENVVRQSAAELVRVTGGASSEEEEKEDADGSLLVVDPNVAITFVVAAPRFSHDDYETLELLSSDVDSHEADFEFEPFYEFAVDLEERLLEEVEMEEEMEQQQSTRRITQSDNWEEDLTSMLGDEITIAPFHNHWFFAPLSNDEVSGIDGEGDGATTSSNFEKEYFDNNNEPNTSNTIENPLNYEKRSPYPTISLVRTSAIMKAGVEATERIGSNNEKTLMGLGSHLLGQLFREKVLTGTTSTSSEGEDAMPPDKQSGA